LKRRRPVEYFVNRKIVLDTGVAVEYIVAGSRYRPLVGELLEAAARGRLRLFLAPTTASEILYVASRIYEAAGVKSPNEEALNYLTWLTSIARVAEPSLDTAVEAGELKKRLHLSLPDCYVIASAISLAATPLFRSLEREMKPHEAELRQLGVAFLDDLL